MTEKQAVVRYIEKQKGDVNDTLASTNKIKNWDGNKKSKFRTVLRKLKNGTGDLV